MNRQKISRPVVTKRTLACENSRFSVFLDELQSQDEPSAPDYLVVAPKQVGSNLVTGVAVLPIYETQIGLIRVYRHAVRGDSWEIPRGFVERAETDLASAARELEEETGLFCDEKGMISLGFVTPDAAVLAARIHIIAALRCVRTKAYTPSEFGHRQFRLFDQGAVREMIARSEIQDPCTLIAYYKYFYAQPDR